MPVRVPLVKEAAALGAALAAGVGAGIYEDLAAAGLDLVDLAEEYEPNEANGDVYAVLTDRWKIAYAAQLELSRSGVTTPMWKAPGL
jgi:autoinducer 2 (AI-2) kinase